MFSFLLVHLLRREICCCLLCVSSKCIVNEVDVFQVLVMCIADRKVINAVRFRRYYVQIEQRQDMANQEHQFPQEWKRL